MEYIWWYKNESTEYDPCTRHCIYGQDADLIMLSLLSHEPNFCIIREEVIHRWETVEGVTWVTFEASKNFQLLYINVLRDYFDLEFKQAFNSIKIENPDLSIEFNLDWVIDDIIFLCFFIGNDFLPSLSVLDIAEASIDMIFDVYKFQIIPETDNYLTENGDILWKFAKVLI